MDDKDKLRTRNMMYTQQLKYLPTNNVEELILIVKDKIKPIKWAYIIHDKDVDENGKKVEPHIHLMMTFQNARYLSAIAKKLKDKEQYLEIYGNRKKDENNGYSYLCHRTSKSKYKYQYELNEVKANFDYIQEMADIAEALRQKQVQIEFDILLNALLKGDVTIDDIKSNISGALYGKGKQKLDYVYKLKLENDAKEFRRKAIENNLELKVIYCYGKSATGKTSYSKELCKKIFNEEPFITGSSRDPFQEYKNQRFIIMNEIRPKSNILYEDLLSILDPYSTDSDTMAPSRYSDKLLCAEYIVITCPYSPREYYEKLKTDIDDIFEQLERRITLTLYFDQDYIYKADYNNSTQKYEIDYSSKVNNKYSKKFRDNKDKSTELFNSIFNDTEVIEKPADVF